MSSTLDILWIVLAFCALWVAAFVCWALYHVAMIARRVHIVMDEVTRALRQIEDAIHGVKEKLERHAGILEPLIALAGTALRKRKGNKRLVAAKKEDTTQVERP